MKRQSLLILTFFFTAAVLFGQAERVEKYNKMMPPNAADKLREGDLRVGHRAPDVTLTDVDGKRVQLAKSVGAKPLVLIFGSYT